MNFFTFLASESTKFETAMDRTEKTSVQESQLVGVKRNADASGIADATSNYGPLSKLFKLNHDCLECVFVVLASK